MLFSRMGKMVRLYFINFSVSHLYLLTLYLCIYWILFMSFWIFVLVFSGVCCEACICRGGGGGRVALEMETRRENAKRMFQSETKPKDCCKPRQREGGGGDCDEEMRFWS